MNPLSFFLFLALSQEPPREGVDFFEKRIRPVLVGKCYKCHSVEAGKIKAELRLDTRDGLLKGGESGPALVPGNPDKSLLVKAIRYDGDDLDMPPKKEDQLSPQEVTDFVTWVRIGAPDPRTDAAAPPAPKPVIDFVKARQFWSLRQVADPPLPAVRDASWPRNAVDRFILAKLEERGLRPVGEADKRTLLRRVTFDLVGLPPTEEEVEAFLADESAGAFEKGVDRLLASPHYGERWGRHWLDVVRYADTAGDNSDFPIPQVYRYRNYVIDAFNKDKPYDQFVREQLAGDLIPSSSLAEKHEKLIATGYLSISRRFGSQINGYPQHLTIEDTIDNLGRTFFGLTINCARCHDHKYDPVTNEDYYALYGFFRSTRYPFPGIELLQVQKDLVPLIPLEEAERILRPHREKMGEHDARNKTLETERAALEKTIKDLDDARQAAPPPPPPADDPEIGKALEAARAEVRRLERLLVEKQAAAARKRLEEVRNQLKVAQRERNAFARQQPRVEAAYAVAEGEKPGNAQVQVRGDPKNLGKEIPRRSLEVLGGGELPKDAKGSGRLELADRIADPANPLTARVMANRIWQHHFGKGIVATPSDFGVRGSAPTHPELLDYLSRRFVESGWSVKAMHRLILSSRTYRLASTGRPEQAKADPNDDWLWRAPRRRLEAEAVRDALLAVSGALDRTPGGPHPFPPSSEWKFTQHRPFIALYETDQRSVYVMTQRIRKHPLFALFDGADTNASTPERRESTTPLQALFLMNDPFVHEQAVRFAERVRKLAGDDGTRVRRAYGIALGRPPSDRELEAGVKYLKDVAGKAPAGKGERLAWESFARVILRLNEFIYVD